MNTVGHKRSYQPLIIMDHSNQSTSDKKKAKKKTSKKDGSRSKSETPTTSKRKSLRLTSRDYLDNDDFSVAPSMDRDVKSVVSVGFDDVYARGRKVR